MCVGVLLVCQSVRRVSVVRWMINFLVGVYVAVIAIAVTLATRYLTAAKLDAVYTRIFCTVLPLIRVVVGWID